MFENLITDRTRSDVDRGTKKGYYNYEDLNRVEQAVKDCAEFISTKGHPTVLSTKTNWDVLSFPTQKKMNRYLNNVKHLKKQLAIPEDTIPLPADMDLLGFEEANSIEKSIKLVADLTENAYKQQIYAGTFESGEEW